MKDVRMTDQPIPIISGIIRRCVVLSAREAVRWLSLAASPTFAIMAVASLIHGEGPIGVLCSAGGQGWPIGSMGFMYGLMTVFHFPPWIRLLGRQCGD